MNYKLINTINNLLVTGHNRGYLIINTQKQQEFVQWILGRSLDFLSVDCKEEWEEASFPKSMIFYDTSLVPITFEVAIYPGNPDFSYFINLEPYFKSVSYENIKYIL